MSGFSPSSPIRGDSSGPRPISVPTGAATAGRATPGRNGARAERSSSAACAIGPTRPNPPADVRTGATVMARPKTDNKPSVATYSDHEIISPPHKLRQAMSEVAVTAADDTVARAEQALARLSGEFSTWMEEEGERLDQARNTVKAAGFTAATRDALFFAAHDIRGDAETLGYPGLTIPAESLCRLIEHTRDMKRIPLALVGQHVDAVRAIIREGRRPDAEQTVANLTRRLRDVTDEFLARENRDRLAELEDILSPP